MMVVRTRQRLRRADAVVVPAREQQDNLLAVATPEGSMLLKSDFVPEILDRLGGPTDPGHT